MADAFWGGSLIIISGLGVQWLGRASPVGIIAGWALAAVGVIPLAWSIQYAGWIIHRRLRLLSHIRRCKWWSPSFSQSTCAVCLLDFDPDCRVVELRCNHIFCQGCIRRWVLECNGKRSPCCPICRAPILPQQDCAPKGKPPQAAARGEAPEPAHPPADVDSDPGQEV
uniref:RING-type domain-containing protein n=1 Tax=Oxyrrhis marina TaxID=2969 RepID=A0A7S4GPI3_OXYMA